MCFHLINFRHFTLILLGIILVPHQSRNFSIVLLHFFIIVPRFFHWFSIANGLTSKPQFFPLLFHSFTQHHFPLHSSLPSFFLTFFPPVLLNRAIVYAMSVSIYPSISSIFPVFCHGVTRSLHHYPYIISVCLTLTQMHLPQSLPLHRINGFARFFHGFISVLLLHSGQTSKPQFFHCFSIVSRVLYAIMVPHRSLNFSIVFPSHQFPSFYFYFTWHHFPSVLLKFSIVFPLFYVIFPHFSIVFLIIFPSIAVSPSPGGNRYLTVNPIATWYITLKKFTSVRLFYHLIS